MDIFRDPGSMMKEAGDPARKKPGSAAVARKIKKVALVYPVLTFVPPLGLITIAAILEKMKIDVIVAPIFTYEYAEGAAPMEDQLSRLRQFQPDMIGVGFMTAEWKAGRKTILQLREMFPDSVLVAGGRHPSCYPRQALEWGADFVVVGEGEPAVVALVEALAGSGRLEDIVGLAFFGHGGEYHFKPRMRETADLDVIPAYHLIPYQKFIDSRAAVTGRYLKTGFLSTSRGCFARCTYCRDPNFGFHLRKKTMDLIFEDMELQLQNYDIDCFYIIDDMFAINERRIAEFCDRFVQMKKKYKKEIYFAATARCDTLTKPMVEALDMAGCTQLSIGVESGSPRIHEILKTKKSVSAIVPAFDLLANTRIDTFVNFIIGVPEETEEDFQMTVDLINRIKPTTTGVSYLTAYPGTELFDNAVKNGWLVQSEFENAVFKHSSGAIQLDSGIHPDTLKSRRDTISKMTFWRTLWGGLRRLEALVLIKDTLLMILTHPDSAIQMLKSAATSDMDKLKNIYYRMVFVNSMLEDHKW